MNFKFHVTKLLITVTIKTLEAPGKEIWSGKTRLPFLLHHRIGASLKFCLHLTGRVIAWNQYCEEFCASLSVLKSTTQNNDVKPNLRQEDEYNRKRWLVGDAPHQPLLPTHADYHIEVALCCSLIFARVGFPVSQRLCWIIAENRACPSAAHAIGGTQARLVSSGLNDKSSHVWQAIFPPFTLFAAPPRLRA